MLERAELHT